MILCSMTFIGTLFASTGIGYCHMHVLPQEGWDDDMPTRITAAGCRLVLPGQGPSWFRQLLCCQSYKHACGACQPQMGLHWETRMPC